MMHRRWSHLMFLRVVAGGVICRGRIPDLAVGDEPLGNRFIKLVSSFDRLFCVVVHGISGRRQAA